MSGSFDAPFDLYTLGELQRRLTVADCLDGEGDVFCRTAVGLGT